MHFFTQLPTNVPKPVWLTPLHCLKIIIFCVCVSPTSKGKSSQENRSGTWCPVQVWAGGKCSGDGDKGLGYRCFERIHSGSLLACSKHQPSLVSNRDPETHTQGEGARSPGFKNTRAGGAGRAGRSLRVRMLLRRRAPVSSAHACWQGSRHRAGLSKRKQVPVPGNARFHGRLRGKPGMSALYARICLILTSSV